METGFTNVLLKHPSRMLIYGPSESGKTTFVKNLLTNMVDLYGFLFENIIYCSNQGFLDINQINGIKIKNSSSVNFKFIKNLNSKEKTLLIIDDNMHNVANDIEISNLFTKYSHHKNISVILLVQNLFPKSKYMRDISTNSTYIVLMSNPRESLQIKTLSYQINSVNPKFIYNCYIDATKNTPYSYLFLDFNQLTPKNMRVRSNILNENEYQTSYTEK